MTILPLMGGHHPRRAMKDGLGRAAVERLARNLGRGLLHLDQAAFVASACDGLEALELKARVEHVANAMAVHLREPRKSIEGILRAHPKWDRGDEGDSLRGFSSWPVFAYIEKHGLALGEFALRALGEISYLFSAEFAVRAFIEKNTKMSMAVIAEWAVHPDEHVRRLASEGIRPRLPWGSHLASFVQDPAPVIAILGRLVDDDSLYVRRSVANNLSDIAVDHPDLVVATCQRWLKTPSIERKWIAKRATRNLIKLGHPGVWALHGFTAKPAISIEGLRVTPGQVSVDQKFSVEFDLVSQSESAQRLVIDFVVHHVKAGGKTSAKVFKLSEQHLAAGERLALTKKHSFRNITTRRYYSGSHRIEIQVNGQRYGEASVLLLDTDS